MPIMSEKDPLLSIRNLSVAIEDEIDPRMAVCEVDLDIMRGQTVALVGESGSGKTLTALAVMGLLPSPPARIVSGRIEFDGMDLVSMNEQQMCELRGARIAMVFQEPGTSLDPVIPVGPQIAEVIQLHKGLGNRTAREQVLALLEIVGVPDPQRRYRAYPHQLSGGIRQRVMIAMALACRPDLLLADEPTSALDATVQAQIIDLLSGLIRDLGMSVLLVTHDLRIVSAIADRVVVVFSGRVVEEGSSQQILKEPIHPYTKALLAVRPFTQRSLSTKQMGSTGDQHMSFASFERCPFSTFCPASFEICLNSRPDLADVGAARKVCCHDWTRL